MKSCCNSSFTLIQICSVAQATGYISSVIELNIVILQGEEYCILRFCNILHHHTLPPSIAPSAPNNLLKITICSSFTVFIAPSPPNNLLKITICSSFTVFIAPSPPNNLCKNLQYVVHSQSIQTFAASVLQYQPLSVAPSTPNNLSIVI